MFVKQSCKHCSQCFQLVTVQLASVCLVICNVIININCTLAIPLYPPHLQKRLVSK